MNWNIKQNVFIKLIQTGHDDYEDIPIWLSTEKIVSIEERGGYTHVSVDGDYFWVKEKAEEIFKMMNYGNE